ncbi:MAG: thioredoxin family protein [Acholeplasmataceae bacterium]|nr:thioredoxin family protein [Acholeplasmataceae bacterium]
MKFIKMIMIVLTLGVLAGCDVSGNLDYSDFKNRQVTKSNAMEQVEGTYYIYIYSDGCKYCDEIKQTVLSYADKGSTKLYLYNFSTYPVETTTDASYSNVGATSMLSVRVYGTPTLFKVVDNVITSQYIGYNQVKNQLK